MSDRITKTKQSDLKLKRRSMFYDQAIEIHQVILDQKLNIVAFNEGLKSDLEKINVNLENFIGKNIVELRPDLKNTERYQLYKEVIKTGKTKYLSIENTRFNKTDFATKVVIFKIKQGIGITSINLNPLLHEIRELEKANQEIQNTNKILKLVNRELEEFSYIAAHDLKSPIANIKTLITFLIQDDLVQPTSKYLTDRIISLADTVYRQLHSLSEVIAFHTRFTNSKHKVNCDILLKNVLSELKEPIKSSSAIIHADFSLSNKIQYDKERLHLVFFHLIQNALLFRSEERAPEIQISTNIINNKPVLFFTDNGIGINENDINSKIFNLFGKVNQHTGGLGIGLYLVNSIIYSHGGYIEVDSKPGIGTTFRIFL